MQRVVSSALAALGVGDTSLEVTEALARLETSPREFGEWYNGKGGAKYRRKFFLRKRGAAGGRLGLRPADQPGNRRLHRQDTPLARRGRAQRTLRGHGDAL